MQKPSIPKGTRDFTPIEMARRNYIFDTIKSVYKVYGFSAIETPAMENLATLLGKYGEEGDKLLFRILNSGNFFSEVDTSTLSEKSPAALSSEICDRGLRYDLTVPFARFVVQHRNEITLPFKRYQIQPVWRADRPQKGRYREFYQCDADIVGSNSLLNEFELLHIIDNVFAKLNIGVTIKLNNRKLLAGIAEVIGQPDKLTDITVAIDKLDKIGLEKVNIELLERGISKESVNKLQPVFNITGNNTHKIKELRNILSGSEIGVKGIEEIEAIFDLLTTKPITTKVELDLTLARGLNYYTGAIVEVKANDVSIGSICGGGRYDDLTGIFGLKDVSGVGISFGADRIYDVMHQLQLFPAEVSDACKVLFINFGEKEQKYCLSALMHLRSNGVSAEMYPDSAKLKKQMAYANTRGIPFVILAGGEEMDNNTLTLKNMENGDQKTIVYSELLSNIPK